MSRYQRNRAAREAERQRLLMGETLEQFHRREAPPRTAPGAGIPRVRCRETFDMLEPRNLDIFTDHKQEE